MEYLWAPWRTEFITRPKQEGCVLCDKPKSDRDRDNFVLYRGEHNYVMLNRWPYNPGHMMVIPYNHVGGLEDLTKKAMIEHSEIIRRCVKAVKKILNAEGCNLGMNLGKSAGAGIDAHIHTHVVPRWIGDMNFMPVIGDCKVVPEALDATYLKLKGHI
ncbi:MAG: HIT domain-containing protein [Chloroflexota bacterium]|nr:HIT domain-containing protein [Chloroflexota bacterium]